MTLAQANGSSDDRAHQETYDSQQRSLIYLIPSDRSSYPQHHCSCNRLGIGPACRLKLRFIHRVVVEKKSFRVKLFEVLFDGLSGLDPNTFSTRDILFT